jgi:hypothetical protein
MIDKIKAYLFANFCIAIANIVAERLKKKSLLSEGKARK